MRKNVLVLATIIAPVLGLGACGQTTGERAATGGGLGAATGAAGAAVTGGSPLGGALLGGAAGAAAGGLTEDEDLDLGDPVWEKF
ncbi:MAG TPA: hypothetical protein VKA18_10610 [Alphaproteobacteria bacterium]|nr:hypothetical protein [Alphaproteobacteria bacterium]